MTSETPIAVSLIITGKVQGVFFRTNMMRYAQERGVVGWVRNNPDGSVEAVVQGERMNVDDVIEWAHRGPSSARVETVTRNDISPDSRFRNFAVVY